MCVCVLFIYTIFVSIICVLWEEPSLIASNQQIYDFYKRIIFENKRHSGKNTFDLSELFITFNKDSCCEHTTGGVHIYLYGYVSLLAPECVVCHFVWVFVYV